VSAPRSYGRWRGFASIIDALLGNGATAGSNKLPAAFTDLTVDEIVEQLGIPGAFIPICSAEIDLVASAGQFFELIPPTPRFLSMLTPSVWITAVGGTRSVAPNVSIGANANANDYLNNQALNAGILTQAINTRTLFGTAISPVPILDLTANGLRIKVESNLTGTVPVCRIRVIGSAAVVNP
jgi:hypothetical protein